MEDTLLVFQSRRGSREALTRIYEKYKADLLLLAMGLLNDKAAAEDVVHDVFLSFVRTLDSFRLTGSLKGFLLTCTANHARNWNKAQRVRDAGRAGPAQIPVIADVRQARRCHPDVAGEPLETLVCNEQLETARPGAGRAALRATRDRHAAPARADDVPGDRQGHADFHEHRKEPIPVRN